MKKFRLISGVSQKFSAAYYSINQSTTRSLYCAKSLMLTVALHIFTVLEFTLESRVSVLAAR